MDPTLIIVPILVVAVIISVVLARRNRVIAVWRDGVRFEERFPPISDAEFMARCTPGTRPEVALKVRKIVAERLAVEYVRVHPSMRFVEDIGAD